jgi:dTDP-4-amino-4,6-dideoxygalactose transaminase
MRPFIGEEECAAVREVLSSGWVSLGPKVAEFEERVAALLGARYAVATNSATTSLHLALKTAGLESGDEVVLPSFTCMANANAVIMAGGKPVFADIERATYNLDARDVEERLTPRTRAVMMVDQIGQPADLDAFRALSARHRLILVDDAATAFGARYRGRPVGGCGIPTCFSFHPRKVITTGEGGMLLTDDEQQAERARVLRSAGASVSDLDRHRAKGTVVQQYFEAGYNYRMTDIQGAIGVVQLGRLSTILTERKRQAERYTEALAELPELEAPKVAAWAEPAWSSYCVRLAPGARIDVHTLVQRMAERGVSCRHGIQPLHFEPYFRAHMAGLSLPETEAAARETLFLPIFPGLDEERQEQVVRALRVCLTP